MKRFYPILFLLISILSFGQVDEKKLDNLIQNTLKTFDVPGMSVGIIKDGKLIYAKGFGVLSLTTKAPRMKILWSELLLILKVSP
ncbi:hypothetical protein [Halpernia sp. GG3]